MNDEELLRLIQLNADYLDATNRALSTMLVLLNKKFQHVDKSFQTILDTWQIEADELYSVAKEDLEL